MKFTLTSQLGICTASRPARGQINRIDDKGNILQTKRIGDWSERCKYCGKTWDKH